MPLGSALKAWQQGRQERVDKVLALNAQIDKRRMPKMVGQMGHLNWDGCISLILRDW